MGRNNGNSRRPRRPTPWASYEDERLRELARAKTPWTEIAENVGRSSGACVARAGKLALAELLDEPVDDEDLVGYGGTSGESASWKQHEERLLMRLAIIERRTWSEIGDRFDRQPGSCRLRAEVIALNQFLSDGGTAAERIEHWRSEGD